MAIGVMQGSTGTEVNWRQLIGELRLRDYRVERACEAYSMCGRG
jgi:hypothetical protein